MTNNISNKGIGLNNLNRDHIKKNKMKFKKNLVISLSFRILQNIL